MSRRALAAACGLLATACVMPAQADAQQFLMVASQIEVPTFKAKKVSHRARLTKRGRAVAPVGAPWQVRRIIKAGNRIAHAPYVWGGGHGSWKAAGYDCSGSVGYALHGARLLNRAVTSGDLASYGRAGKGNWVTIYANGGHVYMVVAGLRFDTSAHGIDGSRWTRAARDGGGYVVRHPAGL